MGEDMLKSSSNLSIYFCSLLPVVNSVIFHRDKIEFGSRFLGEMFL
jgi:hypothetical protein